MKPHKTISALSLSRWYVSTLQQAGVDITVFGLHSIQSISTSDCQQTGLSVKEINKAGKRSSLKTFARFVANLEWMNICQKWYSECKFSKYSVMMLNIWLLNMRGFVPFGTIYTFNKNVKVTLLHRCFSRFLNFTNGTKLRKTSHVEYVMTLFRTFVEFSL